jgi:hypothetical protein
MLQNEPEVRIVTKYFVRRGERQGHEGKLSLLHLAWVLRHA